MTVKVGRGRGVRKHAGNLLRLLAGIVLFPFLWIGIGFNFLGLAERLSFLPGVSKEGGIMSGAIALVLTVLLIGLFVGGASAVLGVDIPVIGGEDDNTPTQTPTPTPTPTLTPTAKPTLTATATPMPTATVTPEHSDLEAFKSDYRQRLDETITNETLIDVPVVAMEYRETNNGTIELWLVYRQCDYTEETRHQRHTVGSDFANTAGAFDGNQPDRLRAYGIDRHEEFSDRIASIPTSSAEDVYDRTIEPRTYYENWNQRLRKPTDSEEEIAFQMTVNESGRSIAEKVFNDEYPVQERDETCPRP